MEFEERRHLEEHFRSLDDADLRQLAALERSQYRPEALEIAMGELARRRLHALSPQEWWQQFPDEWIARLGFCYQCWATTMDESPGSILTVYLIGTRLLGKDDPCPTCKSFVRTKCFCIVLPLIALGRYRVVPGEFQGRRLKDDVKE